MIGAIRDDAWTGSEYSEAIYDEETRTWISKAEVAEIPFTAFTSKRKALQTTGRLLVRRIPELNETKRMSGQDPLFDLFQYHAFFTTVDRTRFDTVAADQVHRRYAIIEQINAELKSGALAHMLRGGQRQRCVGDDSVDHSQPAAGCCRTHPWTDEQSPRSDAADMVHQHSGSDNSSGQETDYASATKWPRADVFSRLWQAALSPPRTVLSRPIRSCFEHDAAGSGGDLRKLSWKRLVRDRGNVSCPLTDSALESERAPGIKHIGGSRLSSDITIVTSTEKMMKGPGRVMAKLHLGPSPAALHRPA